MLEMRIWIFLHLFFFIWIFVDCAFQYFLERRNIWWQDVLSRILFAIVICWISARMEFSFPFFFSLFFGYLWIAQCNSLCHSFIHGPLYKTRGTCWPKRAGFCVVPQSDAVLGLFWIQHTRASTPQGPSLHCAWLTAYKGYLLENSVAVWFLQHFNRL